MNLRNIDLNLLVIFDAVIAERSITRAARKIGISQSAMSHALGRLRATFKDDLVRRTSRGMEPTARALKIWRSVQTALRQIEAAVDEQVNFDPRTSKRLFNIRVSDYLVGCLLPRVCARVRAEAPFVTLNVSHPASPDGAQIDPDVDVQLFVCSIASPKAGVRRERLFQDRFVVVLRSGHPAARKRMTLKLFLELSQLKVEPATIGSTMLDDELARRGLSRQVVLTVPSLTGVLPIIRHSDLCAILPKAWLRLYGAPKDFATAPVPLPEIEFTVDQFSDPSRDRDPGHSWLRRLIQEEMRALHQPRGGSLK
jgi:DNA-binding transcriptional LysR family regulator